MTHAEKKALLDHGSTASANADAATKFRREEHCVYVRVCVSVLKKFEICIVNQEINDKSQ